MGWLEWLLFCFYKITNSQKKRPWVCGPQNFSTSSCVIGLSCLIYWMPLGPSPELVSGQCFITTCWTALNTYHQTWTEPKGIWVGRLCQVLTRILPFSFKFRDIKVGLPCICKFFFPGLSFAFKAQCQRGMMNSSIMVWKRQLESLEGHGILPGMSGRGTTSLDVVSQSVDVTWDVCLSATTRMREGWPGVCLGVTEIILSLGQSWLSHTRADDKPQFIWGCSSVHLLCPWDC
jgi:hypothetical protein